MSPQGSLIKPKLFILIMLRLKVTTVRKTRTKGIPTGRPLFRKSLLMCFLEIVQSELTSWLFSLRDSSEIKSQN